MAAKTPKNIRPDRRNISGQKAEKFLVKKPKNIDENTLGLLFETLCVRDLRIYSEAIGGNVYHYRDNSGLECDTVIHLRNGNYGLMEIKLGGTKLIEEGIKNRTALQKKIDTTKMMDPSFLAIVVGIGEYAYRREDGIYIIPISCLKN